METTKRTTESCSRKVPDNATHVRELLSKTTASLQIKRAHIHRRAWWTERLKLTWQRLLRHNLLLRKRFDVGFKSVANPLKEKQTQRQMTYLFSKSSESENSASQITLSCELTRKTKKQYSPQNIFFLKSTPQQNFRTLLHPSYKPQVTVTTCSTLRIFQIPIDAYIQVIITGSTCT